MRIVVVGGGYGGTAVAQELDAAHEVVLVEPKDAFVHASATLRAVVDPAWQDRVFYPYDQLLARGRVVRDWARLVSPGRVRFSATEEVTADVVVLATGTGYPFPAKFLENRTAVAVAHLERMRADLARCENVLLVGGGPVGVELAGELTSAFPDLGVTIVEREADILMAGDYLPEVRDSVREQLQARGVRIVTGSPLGYLPVVDVGRHQEFTVDTAAGERIEAQMWFRCYGARPATDYLDGELATVRRPDGLLPVTPQLTVKGQTHVFAVGDITDVPESKRASAARAHAAVVAQNIDDLAAGRELSASYTPPPEQVILPLGPDGGAAQVGSADGGRRVLGPAEASRIKGSDLFTGEFARMFGLSR